MIRPTFICSVAKDGFAVHIYLLFAQRLFVCSEPVKTSLKMLEWEIHDERKTHKVFLLQTFMRQTHNL